MRPAEPTETGHRRGLRALLAVLTVHGLAFGVAAFSGPEATKPAWMVFFESIAFAPLQIGSTYALLVAARRADLPHAVRAALRLVATAFACVALGSLLWFAVYLSGRQPDYISWLDAVYFGFYPFLIAALVTFPHLEEPDGGPRDLLSWAVVTIAFGSLTVFAVTVDASLAEMTTALRVLVIVTSAAQLATLIAINRTVERARRLPSSRAVLLLLGALGLAVVGDLVFQILFATGYAGPNYNILLAILANLLVVRAAIAFAEDPAPGPEEAAVPRIPFSPLPIIAVTAVALLLVWMSTTGYATGIGGLMVALVGLNALLVLRDVLTSREAAAAMAALAQRRAERRLEALVRHASDAILLVDRRGNLAFASAPADRLFGVALSAREGLPLRELIPADGRADWDSFVASLRAAPGRPRTHLWHLPSADGKGRMVESIGVDLHDEPAVDGIVLNLRDATERITLEERLRQAQKLEVAGRLAGGVAHDFNNVLTAVIAGTELAQFELPADHPVQADLANIGASAQRGAALTRRLLAFVRQEPVPAQRIDVADTLGDLEPLLARLAGDAHQVEVQAGPAAVTIEVDRNELEHIIFNLVANARDAMPRGGRITVRAEVVTLDAAPVGDDVIIAPLPGRFAAISVHDAGEGMAADVRRRMFDPFFTQKSGGRGTGLGLIGVRPLVEGAQGGLRVDSAPGEGTRVTLLLPVAAGAAAARRSGGTRAHGDDGAAVAITPRDTRAQGAASAPDAPRVLLVEDEPDVREQLARLLEQLGYAPVAVPSAADARAALARPEHGIAAVISDVMMPGETGLAFAAWLRAEHRALPIMLISGHTGTALDREARSSSDLPLLRKPFSRAELGDRLAELLAR